MDKQKEVLNSSNEISKMKSENETLKFTIEMQKTNISEKNFEIKTLADKLDLINNVRGGIIIENKLINERVEQIMRENRELMENSGREFLIKKN